MSKDDIEAEKGTKSSITQYEAIESIKKEEFDDAIKYFSELTKNSPGYHTAWLRLGYATREKAVRMPYEQQKESISLLKKSIEAFTKATEHSDDNHKATAFYEKSKAHYQLFKRDNDRRNLNQAVDDALSCCTLSQFPKYESWLEYLEKYQ